jgi:hypothetical protein
MARVTRRDFWSALVGGAATSVLGEEEKPPPKKKTPHVVFQNCTIDTGGNTFQVPDTAVFLNCRILTEGGRISASGGSAFGPLETT